MREAIAERAEDFETHILKDEVAHLHEEVAIARARSLLRRSFGGVRGAEPGHVAHLMMRFSGCCRRSARPRHERS